MPIARAVAARQQQAALSPAVADQNDLPLRAIAYLLVAMLLFVAMDGMAKYLAARMGPEQIIFTRFGLVGLLLIPALWRHRGQRPLATAVPVLHCLRGLLLVASSLFFVLALVHLPLETAIAIGFVSPLYVTALSIPLLGEKVGPRRWLAVGIGFVGVLAILRPGGAAFDFAMLWPLLSSFCWACSLIITRQMRSSERPLTIMTYSTVVGFLAIGGFAIADWRMPDSAEWGLLLGIAVGQMIAQYLVIRAFTLGPASLLAPFSYSTIVWAVLIGAVVFDSLPDLPTVIGTSVLLLAGLYVWHRERVTTSAMTVPGASIAEVAETAAGSEATSKPPPN